MTLETQLRLPREAIGEITLTIKDLNEVVLTTDAEYDPLKLVVYADIVITTADGQGVEAVHADHDTLVARMPAPIRQSVLTVAKWLRDEANSVPQLTPDRSG